MRTESLRKSEQRNSFIEGHLPSRHPFQKGYVRSDHRLADGPRCHSRGAKSGRKRPNRTNHLYFARLGGRIVTGSSYPRSWQKCHVTGGFVLHIKRTGEVWGRPVSVSRDVRFRPTHPPAPVGRIPVWPGPPLHAAAKPAGVQRCAAWPYCVPAHEPCSKSSITWGHRCQGALLILSTSMSAAACECGGSCSI